LATIYDRSRLIVSVKNSPRHTRRFSHSDTGRAREYLLTLRAQGLKPVLASEENHFMVRIREKGHRHQVLFCTSLQEAEETAARLETECRSGLFIDYALGRRTTLAELIRRYYFEKCPRHKGCDVERYTLKGFYVDAGGDPDDFLDQQQHVPNKKKAKPARVRRIPRVGVQWLNRGIADIKATDIEGYIYSRIEQGLAPATVDREVDLLSQVVNWATNTLRIHLHQSPLLGVERPRYNNERDRRLLGDEEQRLFAAAYEEDRQRSLDIAVNERIATSRAEARQIQASLSTRKRHIAAARIAALAELKDSYPHIALFETLITFLLETASRCGEALALTWEHAYLDRNKAFFPTTKNGDSREVPLRAELIKLIAQLPRTDKRVFPISSDTLQGAFYRICERAGLEDFHPHDLRHEATSQMCEYSRAGGDPLEIQDLAKVTGHRDPRMVLRYTHLCAGEMARRLDEAYAKAVASGKFKKGRVHIHGKVSPPQTSPPGIDQIDATVQNSADTTAESSLEPNHVIQRPQCSARRRRSDP
jgi:integrase